MTAQTKSSVFSVQQAQASAWTVSISTLKSSTKITTREKENYRRKYHDLLTRYLKEDESLETLVKLHGQATAEYVYYTRVGFRHLQSLLDSLKVGLQVKLSKNWINVAHPWLSGNPDAVIVDSSGLLIAPVEFKTFCGKNYSKRRSIEQLA